MSQFTKLTVMMMMVLCSLNIFSQETHPHAPLDAVFEDYRIIEIDEPTISSQIDRNNFFKLSIKNPFLADQQWDMELKNSNIISPDYIARRDDGSSITTSRDKVALPTNGRLINDSQSQVFLTFNDNFIFGAIHEGNEVYYIEPAYHFEMQRSSNKYIVYKKSDLKPERPVSCGVDDAHHHRTERTRHGQTTSRTGDCYEIEYAIANDYFMVQNFGSAQGAENHSIGVTNLIQDNYDDEFPDELLFVIVEQYTATTPGSDPWTSSNDSGDLLDSFLSWAGSGFSQDHDVGSLWSDRDFSGSTIGLAYVGAVCTDYKYNVLQNFSTNANSLRVLTAHELGHNFGASHDPSGSGTIMAPSVNFTDTWSQQSIDDIEDYYLYVSCLSNCTPTNFDPPTAAFTYDVIESCIVGEVEFNSESTGSNLSYEWTFDGADPSFSTEANPVVFYNNSGTFSATLSVSNGSGEDEITMTDIITIEEDPIVDFIVNTNGNTITINNYSEDVTYQEFTFGDGNSSTDFEPTHTYDSDGVYTILLYGENSCDYQTASQTVTIATIPSADFSSDINSGCAPLTVQYQNLSSDNAATYSWLFEGGTPNISTQENPLVTYDLLGTFDVSLAVTNSAGTDQIAVADYITILDVRQVDYSFIYLDDFTVAFTDTEDDGLGNYYWDFGDGSYSTEQNPTHTYTMIGNYVVSFTKSNNCGDAIESKTVSITTGPTADFDIVGNQDNCVPSVITFNNTSMGENLSYYWSFQGGSPSSSTAANPTITYNTEGTYDVSLQVTNDLGTHTLLKEDEVVIMDIPQGTITHEVVGNTVSFYSSYPHDYNYVYNFGNGETSEEAEPTITYSEQGIYEVDVTISNDCGQTVEQVSINLYTDVTAAFSSSASTICPSEIVSYTYSGTENVTNYAWTFAGGTPSTSTVQNPTVIYDTPGSYQVSLTVSNPSDSHTININNYITVENTPAAGFTSTVSEGGITFNNISTDATSYVWDFGDGTSSTAISPNHFYSEEGIYTVSLTAYNDCGSSIYSVDVSTYTEVEAGFTIVATPGCAPFTVSLIDNSSDNVETFQWSISYGGQEVYTSQEENPSFTLTEVGYYDVSLTVSNSAYSDTKTETNYILVNTVPTVGIEYSRVNRIFDFVAQGDVSVSYQWEFGDGNTSQEINPQHIYDEDGTYMVTLTKTNECGSSTATIEVTASSAPSAAFAANVREGCAPLTISFISDGLEGVNYAWVFEGGNPAISSQANPVITYDVPGIYDVELTASNGEGTETIIREQYITVYEEPVESFDIAIEGSDVVITYSGDGDNLLIDAGDGREMEQIDGSYTHSYSEDGTYTITLTGNNICGTFEVQREVTIFTTGTKDDVQVDGVKIYPNPAHSDVWISIENGIDLITEISVIDLLGRNIKRIDKSQFKYDSNSILLDIDGMRAGTYLVTVHSRGRIIQNKLVIF